MENKKQKNLTKSKQATKTKQNTKKSTKTTEDIKTCFLACRWRLWHLLFFAPDRTWALGKVWSQEEVGRALHLVYLNPGTISYYSFSTRKFIQLQTSHRCSNPLIATATPELTTNPESAQHLLLIWAAGRVLRPAEKVPTMWEWQSVRTAWKACFEILDQL